MGTASRVRDHASGEDRYEARAGGAGPAGWPFQEARAFAGAPTTGSWPGWPGASPTTCGSTGCWCDSGSRSWPCAGGVGVLAYLVLWLVVPVASGGPRTTFELDGRRDAAVAPSSQWRHDRAEVGRPVAWRRGRLGGGDGGCGHLRHLAARDDQERTRLSLVVERAPEQLFNAISRGRAGKIRGAGAVLLSGALAVFLLGTSVLRAPAVVVPLVVTIAGLGVIGGPVAWRLLGQLGRERAERIRSQERAEMAAHLHDSFLQTLALIQRAEGPRDMVTLA